MSELKNMVDNNPKRTQLRKSFILTLADLVESDPRIILIIGDVGFSFLEPFKEKYPNQFLNAGIAEQNMMGMAAGMAREGWKPYVYTMSNFILIRPLEQLRNDICFPGENVKLFGVKGSASYKFLGMSHNLFPGEELALLSSLPNITTHFPEDEDNVERIMREEYLRKGPSYMRI
jgi:transketolase